MTQASPVSHVAQSVPSGPAPKAASRVPATGPTTVTRRDRTNPIDQPSVPAVLRLRNRWLILGAVVGAVLGLVAALVLEAGRYTADTVLEIAPTAAESQRAAQLAQAVKVFAASSEVLADAADQTNVDVADLRRRSAVVWEDGTSIVTVSVSARSSKAAQEQSTAIANTVIALSRANSAKQGEEILKESRGTLSRQTLGDPVAEESRKGALGANIANQQGGVIAAGTQITIINPADSSRATGITPPLGAVLGGFAGLVLTTAAALLLPVARHRIKDNREIATLAPSLRLRSRRAAHEQAGRLMESGASTLAVLAMPGAEESARQLADRIVRVIGAHSLPAQLVDARQGLTSEHAAVLRRGERAAGDNRLRVLVAPANEDTVELLAGQSEVLSALVSVPRRTKLEDIQDVATAVATTRPVAIVWS